MKLIRVVAIEDEQDSLEFIMNALKTFPEIELIGSATNIKDAYLLISKEKPDLVFGDIEISGGSLLDHVFKKLIENKAHVPLLVVLSAHPKYAPHIIDMYHEFAIKFIEKPFIEHWEIKFQEAIDVASSKLNKYPQLKEIQNPSNHAFLIKSEENYIRLKPDEIIWVGVAGSGKSLFVTDEEEFLVDMTLNKTLEFLPVSSFLRIHRDYLVNLNHIKKINKEEHTVMVIRQRKEISLDIGDAFYSELIKRMKRE
ncbi:MAG: response regulator transcription factor [Saprospiraceae bacterium]|nr:response regulator transcription factor [Saprospiraceae bacterium]